MPDSIRKTRWKLLAGIALAATGCFAAWQITIWAMNRADPPANAIMVIAP